MHHRIFKALIAFHLTLLLGNNAIASSDKEALTHLFQEYIAAWNSKDYRKIATDIYRTPVYIFDVNATSAFNSPEEIVELLRGLRVELDAAGFSHSELRHVGVCDLGDNLSFATFHYSRFDNTGANMGGEILSSAYIARKTLEGWRLVAHIFQSKTNDISCTQH